VCDYCVGIIKITLLTFFIKKIANRIFKRESKMSEEKEVKLGDHAELDLSLADGKVTISVSAHAEVDGVKAESKNSVVVDGGMLLDKLAALIPGAVDDAVITVLKAALKSV
jgi:hypothetical protein